jgi:glycosyltransferase involved in cell wall biosynthesis
MSTSAGPLLDIVLPVFNEGEEICPVLEGLRRHVRTPCRLLVCYDHEEDTTLPVLRAAASGLDIRLVRNPDRGPHAAIRAGFAASTALAVVVFPADDAVNAPVLDRMVAAWRAGSEIVCASRFMPGGCMVGCPWLKALLVRTAAFTLHVFAGLPTHDATNGFRLFSRRVLETLPIESRAGFTYSLELLVKCHRLGWPVSEVPTQWFERPSGRSRFRLGAWLAGYLRWYAYAFATTYLRRRTVSVNAPRLVEEPAVSAADTPAGASR